VGFSINTAVGGAVVRNRLRRRIKAILDGYPLEQAPFRDLVFLARPGAGELSFPDLVREVERTFGPGA
jgi:ribonuclease P protein component